MHNRLNEKLHRNDDGPKAAWAVVTETLPERHVSFLAPTGVQGGGQLGRQFLVHLPQVQRVSRPSREGER